VKLVDTDQVGPQEIEEAPPHPTPPRPEHRRVAVSFLFTLAVLVGTVVTVYTVFPARHNVVVTAALAEHRRTSQDWEIERPRPAELSSWAIGVLGGRPPLPEASSGIDVVGARAIDVLDRRAAVIGYRVGSADVTVVVQRAHDVPPRRVSRDDGDDRVESWRAKQWTIVVIGPTASAATWAPFMGVPR
jgi:hypothetical protein